MALGAGLGGAGLGALVAVLLPLVGIVTILQGRAARKRGKAAPDAAAEARRAAAQESERRMAAYLAQSRSGSYQVLEDDEQEIRR